MEIPKTLEEAITTLMTVCHQTNKDYIQDFKEKELISLHNSFGRWIRNNFGLWSGNQELIKDVTGKENTHPDDTSMVIIKAFWKKLNEIKE